MFLSAIHSVDNPGPLLEYGGVKAGDCGTRKVFHGSNDAGLNESLKYKKQLLQNLLDSKGQASLLRARFLGLSEMDSSAQFFLSLEKKQC